MAAFSEQLNDFPIYRTLAGTIAGILAESFFGFGIVAGLSGLGLCFAVLVFLKNKRLKHKFTFLNGLTIYLLWLFFGIFIVNFQKDEKPDLQHFDSKIKYAVVETPLEEKAKSFKAVISIYDSLNSQKHKVLAYFDKNSALPSCGDLIGFVSDLQPLKSNNNPLEFDFAEYSARQGIFCSVFIKSGEFKILKTGAQKNLRYYGSKLRDKLLAIYKSHDFGEKELAVLEALTLGYKADLDEETVLAFQKSGSMHILAVSGLHTGIILLIINLLLKFLDFSTKGRIIKFLLTVAFLWLFAAVTGFSPSVCRSALMFSLVAFSQVLNRRVPSYATLAFSAFILLTVNPLLIFNVGFLLSYFAVFSILAVVPLMEGFLLEKDLTHDSKWTLLLKTAANYFIGIILVSVAAQIGTGVLSISVFRQFPVYFILTNVIVIPTAFLIMVSAVILLIFSALTPVAAAVAVFLDFWLKILTNSVSWIESLPGSCIDNIFLPKIAAILLYIAIFFFVIFLIYNKIRTLKVSLLTALSAVLTCGIFGSVKEPSESLIIWNRNKETCISYTKSDSCKVFISKSNINLTPVYDFMKLKRIENAEILRTDSLENLSDFGFVVCGKKVFVLDNHRQLEVCENSGLNVDYLIVTKKINTDENRLRKIFSPQKIIYTNSGKAFVDGSASNFLWKY